MYLLREIFNFHLGRIIERENNKDSERLKFKQKAIKEKIRKRKNKEAKVRNERN